MNFVSTELTSTKIKAEISLLINALFSIYNSYTLHLYLGTVNKQGIWEDHIFSYILTIDPELLSFF